MPYTFQPRFVAYAKAHGKEPQDQLDFDRDEYPSACMMGFILWIGSKWEEFAILKGCKGDYRNSELLVRDEFQKEFDAWIGVKV